MNGRNFALLSFPPPRQSVLNDAPVANLASICSNINEI